MPGRLGQPTMESVGLDDAIEDILITLNTLARHSLGRIEADLTV